MLRPALAAILLATASSVAQQPDLSLPELFKRISPAVATIKTESADHRYSGTATGFLLSPDTLATNHHVIEGLGTAAARFPGDRLIQIDGILADDPEHDVAIVHLAAPMTGVEPLHLAVGLPLVGERIIIIGSPRGLEQSLSDGIVSAIRTELKDGVVLQTTAATSPGSSGSPVLNLRGEVVGIHSFALRGVDGMKFEIPASRLRDLKPGALQSFATAPIRTRPSVESLPDRKPAMPTLPASYVPILIKPSEPPPDILDRLSVDQRGEVAQAARWYIRLPTGVCVNSYRTLLLREIASKQSAASPQELLRALGVEQGDAGTVISVEGSSPSDPSSAAMTLAWPGDLDMLTDPSNNAAVVVLRESLVRRRPVILIADGLNADALARMSREPVVLCPAGLFETDDKPVDVYQASFLADSIATPAQLAHAVSEGKAEIVKYAYTRSSVQERKTIETNSNVGLGSSRSVPDGPCHVTYKWTASTIKLSFRKDPGPPAPPDKKAVITPKPKPAANAPDTLVMRDGRSIAGRVVSENGAEVVFVVVVGGIESEQRFLRYEVKEVRRGK